MTTAVAVSKIRYSCSVYSVLIALHLTGCKTAISHGFGANRIYSGTRWSFELMADQQMETTFADVLEIPICFVADTAILPITLPCSLFGKTGEFRNMLRSEPKDAWGPRRHADEDQRAQQTPQSVSGTRCTSAANAPAAPGTPER